MTVSAVVKGRPHTLHLFVKRENAKDVNDGLDSFEREGLFYESVLPHLEKAWSKAANGVRRARQLAPYSHHHAEPPPC